MRRDIAGRTRERVVAPGPAEAVGAVEDGEVVSGVGQLDSHRDAAGARTDDADLRARHPHCAKYGRSGRLFSTRMNTTPHGSTNQAGAHPRDVRDSADQEAHSLALELSPGGVDVLADQPDVREPVIGQGPVGSMLGAAVDVEVFDHLEDTVAVARQSDDGRLHGGIRTPAHPCRREWRYRP